MTNIGYFPWETKAWADIFHETKMQTQGIPFNLSCAIEN
jgi:hypothetical protein